MRKISICIYLIIIFFVYQTGYSQKEYKPGFIITNSSDTIFGFINLRSNTLNSIECEFKKDENAEAEHFSPDELNSYIIENHKYYVSKSVPIEGKEKKVFLEYLVNGIVNLYNYNYLTTNYYYIEKDSVLTQLNNDEIKITNEYEATYAVNTNQYKGVLKYLFQDAPELSDKIMATGFTYNSLVNITKKYHESVCTEYDCIDYTKFTKTFIYFEPYLGIIGAWMGLQTSKTFANDIQPKVGANFRIKQNKSNGRLNLLFGINLSKNSFAAVYENTLVDDKPKFYFIDIEYPIIRVPFTVEYSFLNKKIQPFLSITYNNVFIINPDYTVERWSYPNDDNPAGINVNTKDFRFYQFGLSPGVGLRYYLNEKSYIHSTLNFEYRIPSKKIRQILDNQFVYSAIFNVGYGFRIK